MTLPAKDRRPDYPQDKRIISVVVPVYSEEANIPPLFSELEKALRPLPYAWHVIFVDDGSTDGSVAAIEKLAQQHSEVHSLVLSRNFGKEIAMTAGIHAAEGDAVICIDADLQHPPELIPQFIQKWERGVEVIIGVRKKSKSDKYVKRLGSFLFYNIMNLISDTEVIAHATDYRLMDRIVVDEFNRLTERNRMMRGLIDWLGFRREITFFDARRRQNGSPAYSNLKLFKVAIASFISHSLLPLRLAGYLGIAIVLLSSVLGTVMITDRYFALFGLNFSGPAILATVILFLVGVVLISIGLLAFYIGHIHQETQGRPLYVIRKKRL